MSCLEAILGPGGLSVLFQPILDVQWEEPRLWAVEALVRGPRGSTTESAPVLFEYVRRKRAEALVDRACIAAVLAEVGALPQGLHFSINVHAATLSGDPEFATFLSAAAEARSIPASRIIVEIVEHAPKWADSRLARGLEALRDFGIRIALDDIGMGQSNYRMMLDCKPDYFKIDRHFVAGSHRDFYRQAVIESVSHLAQRVGARTIAEGIEEESDLETAKAHGISLAQGYLFSVPVSPAGLGAGGFAAPFARPPLPPGLVGQDRLWDSV